MNWDYIAGFFDGEGNINLFSPKQDCRSLSIRIYNCYREPLDIIAIFTKCGSIYSKKANGKNRKHDLFELNIRKKEDVQKFLNNIKDKVIIRKAQVDYVLKNYSFDRDNNSSFNIAEFDATNPIRKGNGRKDKTKI